MTVGLYWEEWVIGREWTTGSRTVTEAAIEICTGLSGDYNPLHTDEEFCKRTQFGTRIAPGTLAYLFASGLLYQLRLYDDTLIAFLGFDALKFTKPVRIGDTIHAKIRVTDKRESSKPDRGIVSRELLVYNQRDEVVLEAAQAFLIKRRPDGIESSAAANRT